MNMSKNVREVMTRNVESARPDMSVKEVAQIMKDRNIGSLPVADQRHVAGLITDRDITIRIVAEGRDASATRVADVMSRDVVSVKENDPLENAERLMHDRQLRRLPVVNEQGELTGYLAMARIAREESPEQAGKVLKGVSQASQPQSMESYSRH
jgi:CBS domain-containing protein